jgi:hypothetical protein
MLRRMALASQWRTIEARLPDDWTSAGLRLTVRSEEVRPRAAAVLGPLTPGVQGTRGLVLTVARDGSAAGPDRLLRGLEQLDDERVAGMLHLVSLRASEPEPEGRDRGNPPLAAAWAAQIAELPADWSDLLGELELDSTDYLDRAALLAAPINPARRRDAPAFRFRCARRFGYGASPGMVGRCLQRLDDDDIRGGVRILRVLADTKPVSTQGPVWYMGGRAV